MGDARRIDQAFELLEAIEQGTAVGSPYLSSPLVSGLLNSLIEAGKFFLGVNGNSLHAFTVSPRSLLLAQNFQAVGLIHFTCKIYI